MHAAAIILLCIASAILYGIIHDQITARICIEYFTIGHPPVFNTDSPTLLALGWGVLATFWVGLILGIPLALAARAGPLPKRPARTLLGPIVLLLLVMAICAALAGLLGFSLARNGIVYLFGPLAQRIPKDRHPLFLADLWAHNASYFVGFIGGIVLIIWTWRSRRRATLQARQTDV
jgi:hypothetical protein